MKNTFNTLLKFAFVLLIFSRCQKDLYEDAIAPTTSLGKINYVSIDQVPYLIPKIQEFNASYDYLSNKSKKKSTGKDAVSLNLDLNRILEYV